MRLDENVFHHKEHSEDAERRVEFLPITAKAVDSHVGDYTTENTIGDAISQRHHDDGDECRYRLGIVVEVDVLDWRHHKQTYDEQHKGGGCCRNGKEDRSKEQRYDEANGSREGCETGTSAQCYTRRTLYVCGGGTCTYACARNGGNSVCHKRFVESGDTTIGAHHASLGTYANEGAHGVEHIDKEEGEYHYEHVERQDVVELKLTEQRADGRRCVDNACERSDALDKDCSQSKLPRVAHGEADGEYKERIETHTWSESERLLCIDSHYHCTDNGSQRSRGEHGIGVHAHACKIGKDTWVYGKDVGHGEECGDACHYLSFDFVLLMVEAKEFSNSAIVVYN